MKYGISGSRTKLIFLMLTLALVVPAIILPQLAAAQTVSVQTAQLIPPGQNRCAAVPITSFTPYIYNNALHSFSFVVSDPAYVAIAGSVRSQDVPFYQMSRHINPAGVRIHVDIETTHIGPAGIPISVTMLSSRGPGEPVCLTIVSASVSGEGSVVLPMPGPTPSPIPAPAPAPTPSQTPAATPAQPSPEPSPTPSAPTTTTPVSTSSMGNFLTDICESGGASRMWFVLLAVYAVIVAAAIFGRPQLPMALRSQEWVAAMIVVPFLVLFGIWYFVEGCRVSAWVPIVATLIALAGLAAAFWDRSGGSTVINLPPAIPPKK